ncbi:MAG: hypothetical protein LBD74_04485 [Spirochaetaceae bacterium]|jgi:hypothetical protein|nr:hypothetical protein [Spirochaetaceae bacterium]
MSDTNTKQKKALILDPDSKAHLDAMHRLGRMGIAGAILVMLGIPTVMGLYFNAMPSFLQVLTTAVGLLALFIPGAFSETIAYSPILGSSYYLAQITGNISNLKLPVAKTALEILDVEEGTEDADIVTSIAVSVSSFVTIAVIVIGILLLQPLRPILSLPVFKQASGSIVQALFGSLIVGSLGSRIGGGIVCPGRWKGAVILFVIVAAVYITVVYAMKNPMGFALYQGFLMLALIPIAWFSNKWLYKAGQITVLLPGEDGRS